MEYRPFLLIQSAKNVLRSETSRPAANRFKASLPERGRQKRPTPSKAWRYKWRSNRHALWNTKGRNVRSKIRWFTEFCNSHYVSHFAAFFIDARTKRSVVESCNYYIVFTDADGNCIRKRFMVWSWWRANPPRKQQVRKRHGWKKIFQPAEKPRESYFVL